MTARKREDLRFDHRIIGDMIAPGSVVLDVGCGNGDLLEYLTEEKNVKGSGVEISEEAIYLCVEKGLSVSHGDIDSGLREYPDKFFDYVIFNQTMQQVQKPVDAISEALRIGRKVIVGFPNFCNMPARFQLFFTGHVPVTPSLPYTWYDTPNLHFLSIKDFEKFCGSMKIRIEKKVFVSGDFLIRILPNLFAQNGIFQITE
ncbi:MAG: methionine biosynthesis protein MetW [Candidatus Omnitrophota bacterium]